MFARITPYKMRPDAVEDAKAMLEKMKGQIVGMNGLERFINVINPDGSGYVISLVESRETAEANTEQVQQIWMAFQSFLEEPPVAEGFDVGADWTP